MTDELKEILAQNNLVEYVELFETHKLNTLDDLKELTESDYTEIGITALGDRKRLLKLFYEEKLLPVPIQEQSDDSSQRTNENTTQRENINVSVSTPSSNNSGSGLAGLLGGVIGAAVVIIIILIVLSNESWSIPL